MTRAAACFIVVSALLAAAPAQAQSAKQEHELADVEKKLKERRNDEMRLRDEAKARQKEVAALRHRMIEAADALQDAERRIAEIAGQTAKLEAEEKSLSRSLSEQQSSLGDALAALQSIERARPPALLVSPEDAARAARTAMLLADVTPQIEARAAALKETLDRQTHVIAALSKERADFEKTNAEVGQRRELLAELLNQKQQERRTAERLAKAAQSETAALAARADSLRGILNRLDKLARVVAPRIKPPAPARDRLDPPRRTDPPATAPRPQPYRPARAFAGARGALKSPIAGNVIGRFGTSRPEGGKFEGLRYAAPSGAIVTAPFEGNVSFARAWGPVGNLIVLDVGGGYHILLLGVGAFLVEEGQTVKAGEPIAAMSGAGAELDLEIRKNGDPVNPSLWLSDNAGADGSS
ncbi:MAG: peptidoglycan DD-metalloendopeptidase family protein [Parvularculaceae bacterium]|nr:peptidoglycan DD-metalloendopeptidase family protein [Parvularculaceae bacterium]